MSVKQENKNIKNVRYDAGFTLVEILVVLAIIGLLLAVGTPQVLRYLSSAKVDTAKTQIRNFESALELYFIDNSSYPTAEQGLNALVKKPVGIQTWRGPYLKLKGDIIDPWGSEYVYEYNKSTSSITIKSFGSDKVSGGDGLGADITN